jgi:hypothetical protein
MAKMIFKKTKFLFITNMNVIHNGMALAVTGNRAIMKEVPSSDVIKRERAVSFQSVCIPWC